MLIFDRYLIKELIGPFIFGISAFSCILAGSTILFPLVNEAVKFNIPVFAILRLLIYKLPSIIVFTLPMSTLLATIMAISRLNSDMEIVAFRASGISLFRMTVPLILMGLLISGVTIGFNELIVPKTNYYSEQLLLSFTQDDQPNLKKNINFTEYDEDKLPLRIINVKEVKGKKLEQIFVAEYDQGQLARLIRADSGTWLSSGGWEFYDGEMHSFSYQQKDKITFIQFKKEYIDIQINPLDFSKREKSSEEMDAKELKQKIVLKSKTGADATEDMMLYHMRFSIPFASLIFSILGVSIGMKPLRGSSAIGFGLSLLIIIIYYILISLGMYFGLSHFLSPILAAWLPNIVIGGTGLFLLGRLAHQ